MIRNSATPQWSWLALLQQWWRADRVRISPRSGQMLRIEPPCILEIEGLRLAVQSREVFVDSDLPCIRYACCDEQGRSSEILARPPMNADSQTLVEWITNDRRQLLDENEIGIYPLTKNQSRLQGCIDFPF